MAVLRSLTERDRFLLDMLAEHDVFTTEQLAELAFPSLHVAQRRLLLLTKRGVLDRFRWRVAVGSVPWHYVLGGVGEAIAAAVRGADPPSPAERRRRALKLAASPRLDHLLGCNGWFCSLVAEARRRQATLGAWWSERRCTERFGAIVRPDGYGAWAEGGREVEFFVEYDTGTETLRRLVEKLDGYAELAAAGGPRLPVCFWLPTATREAHLRSLLADRSVPAPAATGSAELAAGLGESPAGPLWLVPGTGRRVRLVDLGATGGRGRVTGG